MHKNTMDAIKAISGATKKTEALYNLHKTAPSPEAQSALLKMASKEAKRAKRLNAYLKKLVGL